MAWIINVLCMSYGICIYVLCLYIDEHDLHDFGNLHDLCLHIAYIPCWLARPCTVMMLGYMLIGLD